MDLQILYCKVPETQNGIEEPFQRLVWNRGKKLTAVGEYSANSLAVSRNHYPRPEELGNLRTVLPIFWVVRPRPNVRSRSYDTTWSAAGKSCAWWPIRCYSDELLRSRDRGGLVAADEAIRCSRLKRDIKTDLNFWIQGFYILENNYFKKITPTTVQICRLENIEHETSFL